MCVSCMQTRVLAREVADLLRNTIRLNVKMQNIIGSLGGGGGFSHCLGNPISSPPYCWPVSFAGSLPAATEDQIELLASGPRPLLPADVPHCCCLPVSAATEDQIEPEELADLGPRDLSYWVASFFSDVKMLQQNVSRIWWFKKCGVGAPCVILGGKRGEGAVRYSIA